MKKRKLLILFTAIFLIFYDTTGQTIQKIAFGSCGHQNKPQPILLNIASKEPDIFIYLGDNIYGDTRDMKVLNSKYRKLGNKNEFKLLQNSSTILAIWDDHDYGENDAGRHYPYQKESKDIFLDFWNEPDSSTRRFHDGIYHSLLYGSGDSIIQIILLDTRTFRDNLVLTKKNSDYKNDYMPTLIPDSTLLGNEQWEWLENELKKEAKIRVIASSIQFSHEYNGWESWTNFPHERNKMLKLIKKTNANGVLFISGDVHWGEISKLNTKDLYPIYDITSSGLTQTWNSTEENQNRIGEVVMENNFGLIEINWQNPISITFQLFDKKNNSRIKESILLSEISYKK